MPFGAASGADGTYRIGYPEALKELNINLRILDDTGWGTFDVRELVLNITARNKITDRLVVILKNKLVGQRISIIPNAQNWSLTDNSILEI